MTSNQARLVEKLGSADAYPHETGRIRVIETHISWILLTGQFAYKIKKSLRLPFLDFSTLARREHFCREELRLNQRLAAELYLDVVGIGGDADEPRIGAEPVLEYAVRMRQFPDAALADRLVATGDLRFTELTVLAGRVARFHERGPPRSVDSTSRPVLANLAELESVLPPDLTTHLVATAAWLREQATSLEPLLQQRIAAGRVRECHGDLHLGNIARVDGTLLPFDCLEFDESLRTIDTIDEVAFLFMDLMHHARTDLAFAFLNACLEITGDYEALGVLRFFTVHRALVRTKVRAIALRQHPDGSRDREIEAWLDTANDAVKGLPPLLIVTTGLSGSGKTTLARELARSLGAVHIRSDVERKRLFELPATAQTDAAVGAGIYAPTASARTYERLASIASHAVAGRFPVIVDAAFLARAQRLAFAALAERMHAVFVVVNCEAPIATLRERVARREAEASDASEAGIAVLEHQLATAEPVAPSEARFVLTVNTEGPPDPLQLARTIRALAR